MDRVASTRRYAPLAGQARKTSPGCLSGALRWARRAPGEAERTSTRVNGTASAWAPPRAQRVENRIRCMRTYLQHVAQHVHALEDGEPKLRNASWIFHRHGFLFFRLVKRSLFLHLRLRVMSTAGNLTEIDLILKERNTGWWTPCSGCFARPSNVPDKPYFTS